MSDNQRKLRIGITHGDFNGVSYEIIIKSLAEAEILDLFTPVIFGSSDVAARTTTRLNMHDFWFSVVKDMTEIEDDKINFVDVCGPSPHQTLGMPSEEAGKAAVAALDAACNALENGEIDLLVTAPINKHTVQSEEFKFPGHTEFLEARFADENSKATMILFADKLRVATVTGHIPLAEVAGKITKERVAHAIENFNKALKADFRCERPKIAVLSLNPHCGDNGTLGHEEIDSIRPAIEECVNKGILAFGPFAADGLFGSDAYTHYDGILAMYHDQGLAPFKALAENRGVNYTAGLPIVRTSPAHGTAYDKAGHGTVDHTSMREALYAAADIYRNRNDFKEASANPLKINEKTPKENKGRKPEPLFLEAKKDGKKQDQNKDGNAAGDKPTEKKN